MRSIRSLITSLLLTSLLLAAAAQVSAADPGLHVYRGEVAGVMCSACASHVKTALLKLEGVKSVKITLPEGGGVPRIELTSSSAKLTKAEAIKALGDQAKSYDIRSFALEK